MGIILQAAFVRQKGSAVTHADTSVAPACAMGQVGTERSEGRPISSRQEGQKRSSGEKRHRRLAAGAAAAAEALSGPNQVSADNEQTRSASKTDTYQVSYNGCLARAHRRLLPFFSTDN